MTLSAGPPKKWRDAFERAAALLSHGDWSVRLNQRTGAVRLDPVRLGEEERVRQFLEGALLEANRTIVSEDALFADSNGRGESNEEEASAESVMTQRFRSYAGPEG